MQNRTVAIWLRETRWDHRIYNEIYAYLRYKFQLFHAHKTVWLSRSASLNSIVIITIVTGGRTQKVHLAQ